MIVSSLILQADGGSTHGVATYLDRFNRLVELELPIVFFLDRAISRPKYPWWVEVIPTRLAELDTYTLIQKSGQELKLPSQRKAEKDTLDFLTLMNAKTEFVTRATELCASDRFSWVDCGVSHVLKDPQSLEALYQLHRLPSGITLPGPRDAGPVSLDHIHWRFCGGFVSGDRQSWKGFHRVCQNIIRSTLPRVTWEVNIWAYAEISNQIQLRWYYGDHNDSLFNFASLLRSVDA